MAIATKPSTADVFGSTATGDYLLGTASNDIITGGGSATISYTANSDGTDTMEGSAGDDVYIINNTSDLIIENPYQGKDTIYTSVSYTLPDNVENIAAVTSNIAITGNSADNWLDSGSFNNGVDTVRGMGGNDTYFIDFEDKVIEGQVVSNTSSTTDYTDTGGMDTLVISGLATGNIVDISHAITDNRQQSNTPSGTTQDKILGQAYIENVLLTGSVNANLIGNAKDNQLAGNDASNSIVGGAGNDILDGGVESSAKTDTLAGGAGNDTYIIRNSGDIIDETTSGSTGTDIVKATVSYTLPVNVENLTLTGTSTINGTGNSGNNIILGNDVVNSLSGADGTDSLNGFAGNDTLDGGAGNDTLNGGAGKDTINAGLGNDVIKFASGTTDTFSNGTNTSTVDWYQDLVLNGSSADKLDLTAPVRTVGLAVSGSINDSAFVSDMNNLLIASGKGFKQYTGGIDAAIINVTAGSLSGKTFLAVDLNASDTFSASDFVIEITNSTVTTLTPLSFINTALTFTGTSGNDTFDGRAGNDLITGGLGRDVISTGGGNDIIRFGSGATDSYALNNSIANIDWYKDLNLNGNNGDGISLSGATVVKIGTEVTGALNERSFINDMNSLLITSGKGFKQFSGGVDASVVTATSGSLSGRKFLAVDSDSTDTFTASDFVIDITNSTVTSLTLETFKTTSVNATAVGSTALNGGMSNDNLNGDSQGNTILAGAGMDTLTGNAGNDNLNAGSGNDIINGGAGQDTIIAGDGNDVIRYAAGNTDSSATASSIANVDLCKDLIIDANNADKIDLTVYVAKIGTAVSGSLNQASFVANMNSLLTASGSGFVQYTKGIDAAIVTATAGDLSSTTDRVFLAVDLDSNDSFTTSDLVIEITGSSIGTLTTSSFM